MCHHAWFPYNPSKYACLYSLPLRYLFNANMEMKKEGWQKNILYTRLCPFLCLKITLLPYDYWYSKSTQPPSNKNGQILVFCKYLWNYSLAYMHKNIFWPKAFRKYLEVFLKNKIHFKKLINYVLNWRASCRIEFGTLYLPDRYL